MNFDWTWTTLYVTLKEITHIKSCKRVYFQNQLGNVKTGYNIYFSHLEKHETLEINLIYNVVRISICSTDLTCVLFLLWSYLFYILCRFFKIPKETKLVTRKQVKVTDKWHIANDVTKNYIGLKNEVQQLETIFGRAKTLHITCSTLPISQQLSCTQLKVVNKIKFPNKQKDLGWFKMSTHYKCGRENDSSCCW